MNKRKLLYTLPALTLLIVSLILANFSVLKSPTAASAQEPRQINLHSETSGTPKHMDLTEPEDQLFHMDLVDPPLVAPVHMDLLDPTLDFRAPITSNWHELYPRFSSNWHLSSWTDNGDLLLSPSDQIDMKNSETGKVTWYHLDKIVTTLFWTTKPMPPEQPVSGAVESTIDYNPEPITDPISTEWHEVFPYYSHTLHITSWVDQGDRVLSASDQIDMKNATDGLIRWYHVDRLSIDIILTPKGPIQDPVTTLWQELYPTYSTYWHLSSWTDNGDRLLSASDQIDMTNRQTGEVDWFHVEQVTTTLWWTMKQVPGPNQGIVEAETIYDPKNPVSSGWHEVFPIYSHRLHITSWEDNGDGVLSPSDQIDMKNATDGLIRWYHVDRLTTDIILKKKPLSNPVSTLWHEIYPDYCTPWHLRIWTDNGDGVLSASDQIDMTNQQTGRVDWFHVDRVTTTMFWTVKETPILSGVVELIQPIQPGSSQITDPLSTWWHQIFPTYSNQLHITSWEDNGDGVLSPSDQIDMYNATDGRTRWYHVDRLSTDIILTPKGPIGDPITTEWKELYPTFGNYHHLSSWEDNGDGLLSVSDQVDMLNRTDQRTRWYHVDDITTTIFITDKTTGDKMYVDLLLPRPLPPDPTGSDWHEIWPYYCNMYHMTQWVDNGDGVFSPSDQVELIDAAGLTHWYHVDEMSTDLILTEKVDIHDVAVTDIWSCYGATLLAAGLKYKVNITVTNEGMAPETFTLQLFWNTTNLINQTIVPNLLPTEERNVTITWNTAGYIEYRVYKLRAYAIPVPGEVDIADNDYYDPRWIRMTHIGDFDLNKKVEIKDLAAIARLYGAFWPQPKYDPNYDINNDGKIDIKDLALAAKNFGWVGPP